MPHSYGADLSGVGLLGPRNCDSTMLPAAKPPPTKMMRTRPNQPSTWVPGSVCAVDGASAPPETAPCYAERPGFGKVGRPLCASDGGSTPRGRKRKMGASLEAAT